MARESQGRLPKTRPETLRRRIAILKAATEVFGLKGYANASLSEIAERVGMTHAGVLHHFGSKENLLLETVRYRDFSFLDELGLSAPPGGHAAFDHLIETAFRNEKRPGIVQAFSSCLPRRSPTTNPRPTISEGATRPCAARSPRVSGLSARTPTSTPRRSITPPPRSSGSWTGSSRLVRSDGVSSRHPHPGSRRRSPPDRAKPLGYRFRRGVRAVAADREHRRAVRGDAEQGHGAGPDSDVAERVI